MKTAAQFVPVPAIPMTLHRLRFRLEVEGDCRVPRYPGSAIRGLLGHGLKKTLCVTGQSSCDGCALLRRCGYARFFESPAHNVSDKKRFSALPHAWVLDLDWPSPTALEAGQGLEFRLTLLGEMVQSLPWLVVALEQAGSLGIGREHVPFRLAGVWHEPLPGSDAWVPVDTQAVPSLEKGAAGIPVVPEEPGSVSVRFLTPLRLKRDGKLVTPDRFSVPLLLNALRLRFRDLLSLYGQPGAAPELPAIPGDAEQAGVRKLLRWQDWTRYSSRQRTAMKLGGIVGEVELDLERLPGWWPLLWYGQWIHMGKQTSMGLGQYRVVTSL